MTETETGLGLETTVEERALWLDEQARYEDHRFDFGPPSDNRWARTLRDIDRLLAALSASREQEREACELLTLRARDADENSFCRKVLDKLAIIRARGPDMTASREQFRLPAPEDRDRLARQVSDYADAYKNDTSDLGLSRVLTEAAAALRLPAPEEVEAMVRQAEAVVRDCDAYGIKAALPTSTGVRNLIEKMAALLRRLAAPATGAGEWQPTHRHYKGGLYRVIARGRIEFDLEPVVIYDNAEGETWVRPVDDFEGWLTTADRPAYRRFEPLPAAPSLPDTEGKP